MTAHRGSLCTWEHTTVTGVPCTTAARTLIDLAAVAEDELLERALDSALRKGLVTVDYLQRWLARYAKRPVGAAAVDRLLEQRSPGRLTESDLETMFLRLLRRARLPLPAPQYEITGPHGFVARVDFAYPDRRIAIECDGYAYHHARRQWVRDAQRDRALALAGWTVFHITYWDLSERPDGVVAEIAAALGVSPLFTTHP